MKPLPAGGSPEHHHLLHHRSGALRHDPAWLTPPTPRGHFASGEGSARATAAISRIDTRSRSLQRPDRRTSTSINAVDPVCLNACRSSAYPLRHQPKSEIPIAPRVRPAGSCMRGFRTPAAPETLHHVGRSACPGTVPEPAVRQPSREYGARSPKNELPCASSFPSPLSAPRWDNYPLHAVSIDMNLHLAPTQP